MVTRAHVEKILIQRAGRLMAVVGMDTLTINGTNVSLADPVSTALRGMGIAVGDHTNPQDAELALVTDDRVSELLDRAELRLLETIQGNWDEPTAQQHSDRQQWADLLAILTKRIAAMRDTVAKWYPDAANTPAPSVINFNFQSRSPSPSEF